MKLTNEIGVVKNRYYSELELAQKEIIYILSDIMESDSGETACHVKRVASISKQLALLDGHLSEKELELLDLAAPLHDIGKLMVDNSILHKPGKLTDEEFITMKKHPFNAVQILKKSNREIIKAARVIAYEHHENYDGTGYPRGIKGDEIHIYARIVAIADVLDALTHKRCYKEAWSFEKAAKYIIDQSGCKFDPHLVTLFHDHLELFKEIIEGNVC
jgi:putative two-component system response regulator